MTSFKRSPLRRRGAVLIYVTLGMVGFAGVVSMAIDVSHVRIVKTELQQAADAAAYYAASGLPVSPGQSRQNAQAAAQKNYADGSQVTVNVGQDVIFGTWNDASKTFTATAGWSSSVNAVKVIVRRTSATNNPVNLTFASIVGFSSCDVTASAVARIVAGQSANVTVSATSDPWLAGMPAGSTASYDDTAPGQSPMQVTSIPVIPGTYITLSNVTGQVRHAPTLGYDGPSGSTMYSHGIDSPGGPTPAAENGIADIVVPIDSFLGLFLDNNQPDSTAAPARRDYSTAAARDQATYDDIQLKQPFYIGSGQNSSGTTQQFRVPTGATRLYLGTMDGYEWNNNSGSFSATISVIQKIEVVQ